MKIIHPILLGTMLSAVAGLTTAHAQETLKVGNIESLTGPYAVAGIPNGCGILIAQDHINGSADLAKGYTIEILQQDDQSKPAFAVQAASRLTGDGVRIFVGGTGSPTVLAELPIFNDVGALFTGGTSKSEQVMQTGGNVVRVNSNAGQDGAAVAAYLEEIAGGRKIAYVGLDNAYSKGILESVQSNLTKGTEIPYVYMTPADTTDYRSVVTNIVSDQPDVMLVGLGSQTQIVSFLREFKRSGTDTKVVITAGLLFPGVSKAAGGAAEGATSMDVWTAASENAANSEFAKAYETYAGNHPLCKGLPMDKQMALSFTQLLLVAKAIDKTGSADPAALYETIKSSEWELPQGTVRFDESGQAQVGYTRIVSKGDTVVPVE